MFKVIFFLWRRSDLTREEYRRHYEDRHAVLISSVLPRGVDYRRSYPEWECAAAHVIEPINTNPVFNLEPFDSMSELWFDVRADCENVMSLASKSPARETIQEDEGRFINRAQYVYCAVDERGRGQSQTAIDRKASVKIVRFVQRSASLSNDEFREIYERELVPLKMESMPSVIAYHRNYPIFDDPLSFIGIYSAPVEPYRDNKHALDLIEEVWCSDVNNLQNVMNILNSDSNFVNDRSSVKTTEYRSPYGRLMAPVAN